MNAPPVVVLVGSGRVNPPPDPIYSKNAQMVRKPKITEGGDDQEIPVANRS